MLAFRLFAFFITSLWGLITLASVQAGAVEDPCGLVLQTDGPSLSAKDVYACLAATPFYPDVAKELLSYWRTTVEFQSTLAYLKDPPPSYQQQSIDLIRGLDLIRTDIDTGVYESQYAFEVAVQDLLYAAHDTHVALIGSILGIFTFGAPFQLASISNNGIDVPRIYLADDLANTYSTPKWKPSPVNKINGELAEDFLALHASQNSFGFVEPHGEWNEITFSAARGAITTPDSFLQTIFYPGDELAVEFDDGTIYGPVPWLGYNVQARELPSVRTSADLYEYFVRGREPATNARRQEPTTPTTNEVDAWQTATTVPTDAVIVDYDFDTEIQGWGGAYPEVADIKSPDLGYEGVLTGYFLREAKIGVLSMPSFSLFAGDSETFSRTVADFLRGSKAAGMEKIVVDLQQNDGGVQLLATSTFKQFFPNIEPFSGMRTRSFETADHLGNTFTSLLQNNASSLNPHVKASLTADPFGVVLGEFKVDGQRFADWADYFGPHSDRNDQFSTIFKYDLTNEAFVDSAGGMTVEGSGNASTKASSPYAAQDIVLLTDGACASTCDLFMEMMHHEAGVRTVVVGGMPQHGPMQARGQTRGAFRYSSTELDDDFEFAGTANQTLKQILPDRKGTDSIQQSYMTINLADQIRPRENSPLQFVYEAADCRIFWTPETINNLTALWIYAADATFRDARTCVPHSAEHRNTMATDLLGPSPQEKETWAKTNRAWKPRYNESITAVANLAQLQYYGPGTHEAGGTTGQGCLSLFDTKDTIGSDCANTVRDCGSRNLYVCKALDVCTMSGQSASLTPQNKCQKMCDTYHPCPCEYACKPNRPPKGGFAPDNGSGWCVKLESARTQEDRYCRNHLPTRCNPSKTTCVIAFDNPNIPNDRRDLPVPTPLPPVVQNGSGLTRKDGMKIF